MNYTMQWSKKQIWIIVKLINTFLDNCAPLNVLVFPQRLPPKLFISGALIYGQITMAQLFTDKSLLYVVCCYSQALYRKDFAGRRIMRRVVIRFEYFCTRSVRSVRCKTHRQFLWHIVFPSSFISLNVSVPENLTDYLCLRGENGTFYGSLWTEPVANE